MAQEGGSCCKAMVSPGGAAAAGPVALVGLALRLALGAVLPPGYDEAHNLIDDQHFALWISDHPLGAGLCAWLGVRPQPSTPNSTTNAITPPNTIRA